MAFGSGKKVEELEAEVARLNQWVAHLQGTEAVALAGEVEGWRSQVADLQAKAAAATHAAELARTEEQSARADLAEDLGTAGAQEAGFYTFNHPLADAVAYKSALVDLQARMKAAIRAGQAVEGAVSWTVNNSAAQGRKMVKDFSTLMLRAYNAEADSLVRALRPHTLGAARSRLDKSALAIERLGKTMSIRISPQYHQLRIDELGLTADYLVRKQQEKEAEHERRADLRDQAKAAAEMVAALDKLRKEQEHYRNLLAKLDPATDAVAYANAQAKLDELGASISGVEQRAANIRTGHVYVISNVGAFGPNMVKIGMTRRLDPMDRVIELGDASVPFRFDVHAMVFHEDAVSLETHLHQALAERKVNRINPRREFFYATPAEVREIFSQVAGAQLVEYHDDPDALEWRASGSVTHDTQGPASEGDLASDALSDAMNEGLEFDLGDDTGDHEHVGTADLHVDDELDTVGAEEPTDEETPATGPSPAPEPAPEVPSDKAQTPLPDAVDAPAPQVVRGEPSTPSAAQDAPAAPVPAAVPAPATPVTAAGWFPNPENAAQWRYWDGTRWTANVSQRT